MVRCDSNAPSLTETLLSLRPAVSQPLLQLLQRGRLDEDVERTEVRLLHRLHALHVDVEDADLAPGQDVLDGRLAGAVHVAAELGVLDELTLLHQVLHGLPGDVVVVPALHLPRPGLPGGVGDAEPEILPELGHQLLHHGGLPGAAGPAEHQGAGQWGGWRWPDRELM